MRGLSKPSSGSVNSPTADVLVVIARITPIRATRRATKMVTLVLVTGCFLLAQRDEADPPAKPVGSGAEMV
jgi:hypothetical protein